MNYLPRCAALAACLSFAAAPCPADAFNPSHDQLPGTTVVDVDGRVVGYNYLGVLGAPVGLAAAGTPAISRNIKGAWYSIPFNILGFVGSIKFVPSYAYVTPDCSGDKYFTVAAPGSADPITPPVMVLLDQSQPATRSARTGMPGPIPLPPPPPPPPPPSYNSAATLYFARPPYSLRPILSSNTAANATCNKLAQPSLSLVGVADSVHLSFTPPFTVK